MSTDGGDILIAIARGAISAALRQTPMPATEHAATEAAEDAAWLQEPGATFVTLMQRGQLRGCIGTLQPHRSVLADVRANAVAAALRDPRFSPLRASELPETEIEVSLLSPTQPMTFGTEADALAQLRPGIDGVVLEFGYHRSTFLPQVWEQLPGAREFLAQLKQKAGLPPDFWAEGLRLQRYTVSKWKQSDPASVAKRATSKASP